jgi:periplasmic protein TonB
MLLRISLTASTLVHGCLLIVLWCYGTSSPRPQFSFTVVSGASTAIELTAPSVVKVSAIEAEPIEAEQDEPRGVATPSLEPDPVAAEVVDVERAPRTPVALDRSPAAHPPTVHQPPALAQRPLHGAEKSPRLGPAAVAPLARTPRQHLAEANQEVEVIQLAAEAIAGAKVDQLPQRLPANRPPSYPREALRQGIEGRVLLRLRISISGQVDEAGIASSSGSTHLDDAALAAVLQWKFDPARRAGEAVAFEVIVPVRFSINRG